MRTAQGVRWNIVGQGIRQAVQFGTTILISRLLAPDDFGVFAMALVVATFLSYISEVGVAWALVQRRDDTELHRSTAFWLNLALGALAMFVLLAGAPLIAGLFDRDVLVPVVRVLALTLPIQAATGVHRALLRRWFAYKRLVAVDTIPLVVCAPLIVLLALNGFGVWSLVWYQLATTVATSALLLRMTDWSPTKAFSRDAARDLWAFSGRHLGYESLTYWARSVDNVLVGRAFGAAALGVYARAFSVMLRPVAQLQTVLGTVAFPALSRLQDDRERLARAYEDLLGTVVFAMAPVTVALAFFADDSIYLLFGPKWSAVASLVRLFSIVTAFQTLLATATWVLQALGRTRQQFRIGLGISTATIAGFVVATALGSMHGFAYSHIVASGCFAVYSLHVVGSLLRGSGALWAEIVPCFAAAALAGGLALLLVPGLDSPYVRLPARLAVFAVCYLALVRGVAPRHARRVMSVVRRKAGGRRG